MCHIEDETGSIEAGKCADLLVVNGDVAADIHVLNTDNMDVIMKDNLCWLADGKSIAGSVLTLAQGVKNIVDWGIASADIAIRMATEVPARSAHIEGKCGSIMPGRDADFVVFNPDLTLVETYVGGNSVGNAFTE